MGQAAVELPEPTDPPTAPPQASADDLLSKLAGDEIDRMLAEVESTAPADAPVPTSATGDPTPMPASPASTPAPSGLSADAEVQQQLDALFNELSAPPVAPGAAQDEIASIVHDEKTTQAALAMAEVAAHPERQDQVDDLINQLSNEAPPVSASASTLEAAESAAVTSTGAAESAASGDSLDAQLVQSLGEASQPTPPRAPADKSQSGNDHEAVTSPSAGGEPWYVKPLELLNAPFASLKPEMRELLGKVAIVTAFNAVVIFVYVLVIRGR